MGVLKKIREFAFGKQADIFDADGKISHNLPPKKWSDWNQERKSNPEYNWRNHNGRVADKKNIRN